VGTSIEPATVSSVYDDLVKRVLHPMTANHRIIVSGVVASVHVYNERLYKWLTLPLRLGLKVLPLAHADAAWVHAIMDGWDVFEELASYGFSWLPFNDKRLANSS